MHEQARLSGAFPSLAGKIGAYFLGKVSWKDVRGAHLSIPEVEHSHVLLICTSGFNYFTFLFGSEFEFLFVPPSELAGLRLVS